MSIRLGLLLPQVRDIFALLVAQSFQPNGWHDTILSSGSIKLPLCFLLAEFLMKSVLFLAILFLLSNTIACQVYSVQESGEPKGETGLSTQLKFEAGEQVANSITVRDSSDAERQIKFWLYAPENYAEVKLLPCIMFLHGMGERGEDLASVKQWGPPKLIAEGEDFPFIVISPLCPKDIVWKTDFLQQILDAVIAELNVDEQRVYMTGLSMGGYGTWAMLAACPDRIAAAIPICGGGDPSTASKMTAVPIWAFHGSADSVVGADRSREMVEAVSKAKGTAKLTVYEAVGHNSWSQTYSNSEIYDWLLRHRRRTSNDLKPK